MLKHPLPSPRRWIAGTSLVTLMTLSAGIAAWAAQPAVPGDGAEKTAPRASQDSRLLNPPTYPKDALAKDVSGKVVLLVDIDAKGNPTAIAVKSAEPAGVFEDEAAAAAWNWKFNPAIEDGKPVASQVLVPVHFEADGTPPEDEDGASSGAMGWITPEETGGEGDVSQMTCNAVRGEASGGSVACGNERPLAGSGEARPDPSRIDVPAELEFEPPTIEGPALEAPAVATLLAAEETCPEGAFLGPASVGKAREIACRSRNDGSNRHQNRIDRVRHSIDDRHGAYAKR